MKNRTLTQRAGVAPRHRAERAGEGRQVQHVVVVAILAVTVHPKLQRMHALLQPPRHISDVAVPVRRTTAAARGRHFQHCTVPEQQLTS